MRGERRKFIHESGDKRREDLVAAALELIGEGGAQAATVRAIAERAGVTPGLIRHYFSGKDELLRMAYSRLMGRMVEASDAATDPGDSPERQLATFVAASFQPPIMDQNAMGLWAGFLHLIRRDVEMAHVHEATYLAYRDRLEALIAPLMPGRDTRPLAIACNALIDGLWLEGSALPEAFAPGELSTIAVTSIGAILGVPLPLPEELS